MGLFDGRQVLKDMENKRHPVSGRESKLIKLQITTADNDFTGPIAESTTN
jgi:hypothetical protein